MLPCTEVADKWLLVLECRDCGLGNLGAGKRCYRGSTAATQADTAPRTNSFSRRRWNAFEAWQEHVRKSAESVGVAFAPRADRDLRRAVVAG